MWRLKPNLVSSHSNDGIIQLFPPSFATDVLSRSNLFYPSKVPRAFPCWRMSRSMGRISPWWTRRGLRGPPNLRNIQSSLLHYPRWWFLYGQCPHNQLIIWTGKVNEDQPLTLLTTGSQPRPGKNRTYGHFEWKIGRMGFDRSGGLGQLDWLLAGFSLVGNSNQGGCALRLVFWYKCHLHNTTHSLRITSMVLVFSFHSLFSVFPSFVCSSDVA